MSSLVTSRFYTSAARDLLAALLLHLLLQHSLDDLLFLNQESTDDALLHASGASGATVSAGHGLLASLGGLGLDSCHALQLMEREKKG